ncbi:MAG TPA: protein kinase [Paucimonas sp.]|nr:protein kinase [Paucimonas sp.]
MELSEARETQHGYRLGRLLGEGGFGQVYEAWDIRLQRRIAVKRLKPLAGAASSDALIAEARIAASLRHAAFVKVFAIEGDGDRQAIVMEFVDGRTLRQHAQQAPLTESAALDIVHQVAQAMAEAHASGLVHGDIKPSNLMIEPAGRVRILDFGLARRVDYHATVTAMPAETPGTVAYMAPEILSGARPSEQSDIYALGVILYELLAGTRPFLHLNGLALAAALVQTSSQAWEFPAPASASAIALVRAMTARDIGRRLSSMDMVCEQIATLRQDATAAGNTDSRAGRRLALLSATFGRLRARTLWSAVAVVVSVCAIGVWRWNDIARLTSGIVAPYSESAAMRAGFDALRTYDRNGSIDAAVASFGRILEHRPEHAAAAAGLSLAYSLRFTSDGRDHAWLKRAEASAQQALAGNDQLALALTALARVRLLQRKLQEAETLVDKALGLDPLDVFALSCKADLLLRLRRFEAAETFIRHAIDAHPGERWFTDALGLLYYQQKKFAEAEQAFKRSIALDPDAAIGYANLSAVLTSRNRPDEALRVLQQGLQVRPSARLYGNLGTALFARGDYPAAAQAFAHAVSPDRGNPADYLNWANLADVLRWMRGREDESRQAYRKAAELLAKTLQSSPTEPLLLSRMGLYRSKLGESRAAVDATQQALLAAPKDADIQFRAAIAFELAGDRGRSVEALLQARSLGYPSHLIDSEPDLLAVRRETRFINPHQEKP